MTSNHEHKHEKSELEKRIEEVFALIDSEANGEVTSKTMMRLLCHSQRSIAHSLAELAGQTSTLQNDVHVLRGLLEKNPPVTLLARRFPKAAVILTLLFLGTLFADYLSHGEEIRQLFAALVKVFVG